MVCARKGHHRRGCQEEVPKCALSGGPHKYGMFQLDENDADFARGGPIGGLEHTAGSQGYGGRASGVTILGRDCGITAVARFERSFGFSIRALQRSPGVGVDGGAPQAYDR